MQKQPGPIKPAPMQQLKNDDDLISASFVAASLLEDSHVLEDKSAQKILSGASEGRKVGRSGEEEREETKAR